MLVDVQHKLQAEGRDLTSVAAAFDSDGDGLLLPTEMEDLLIAIGLENMLQQDAERQAVYLFLDQYAVDASGRIDYARFMDETAPVHEGWLESPTRPRRTTVGAASNLFHSSKVGGSRTRTRERERATISPRSQRPERRAVGWHGNSRVSRDWLLLQSLAT